MYKLPAMARKSPSKSSPGIVDDSKIIFVLEEFSRGLDPWTLFTKLFLKLSVKMLFGCELERIVA